MQNINVRIAPTSPLKPIRNENSFMRILLSLHPCTESVSAVLVVFVVWQGSEVNYNEMQRNSITLKPKRNDTDPMQDDCGR